MDSKRETYSRGYTTLGKYHFRSLTPRGNWQLGFSFTRGPFRESSGNFSGPELYFKIKIHKTLS